ncbi:putative ribonuclease H-like domain-containing protein [Tanacetum coccineum]|uniref:Ribonuclease H-like domain-containing protein n=1 Tax=Tanacetum coccineum TaxID=301880 RepID=A0ABQ4Y4P4_9ASTR
MDASVNSTNTINTVSPTVNAAGIKDNVVDENIVYGCADDPNMPELEDIVYSYDDEDVGAEADMNNLDAFMPVSPILTTRIHKDHLVEQIIRDLNSAPQTRRMTTNLKEHGLFSSVQQRTNHKDFQNCLFACFLSQEEPKKVWSLVELPNKKRAIGTKWVFRNKKDERGIVIKNKARLVAQGYTQEEGIDYDEVFAHVARIEAIRLFLHICLKRPCGVTRLSVKCAFLICNIEEEVYVCQPPGFEDPDFPDRVYKVEKTLYRLHQAPRAWYETLSTYLLNDRFQRGKIDKTLFIRRDKGDILLVQVYVDDIIFGSTKKELCTKFKKMMHKKFQMSSMGELTFFLGMQVKQKEDGIFISQDKYVTQILKKFGFSDVKTASTPMETHKPLLKDADGEDIDKHLYRSMIGSLMYLTSLRPNIMFAVCQPKLGLWYPKDLPFDFVAYTDSDYAGASLDRKSTTGGCQFLGCRLISWQCKKQTVVANSTTEAEYIAASNWEVNCVNMKRIIHKGWLEWNAKVAKDGIGVKTGNSRVNAARHYLVLFALHNTNWHYLENAYFAEIVDFLNANPIRYALTISPTIYVSCIEQFWSTAKTKIVNNETQIHAKVEGKTIVISKSSVRRDLQFDDEDDETITKEREDRMEAEQDSEAQTRFEIAFKHSNDPPLIRVNTLGSGEDRLTLKELMDLCTKLFDRVLDLEITKTTQAKDIASLKKRVKKLERKRKSKTPGMNLFKIGTSKNRSLGEEDASKQGRNLKQGKQSSIFKESNFDDEGFDADMDEVFKDVEGDAEQVISAAADEVSTDDAVNTAGTEVNTASAPVTTAGVFVSIAEPITTVSVNITTAEPTTPLTTEPTTPLTTTTIIFEDKDLTIAQTLVKIGLKNKTFDEVQKAFDKTMSWIDSFVPMDSEVVKGSKDRAEGSETRAEGSSKRAGEDLQQESTKKQKMDDDKEKEELKQCFEIVPDDGDDVTIDATPLSVKIPIVDYKIYQEGKKSFFQIIKANGKTQMYLTFSKMLKNFDREDLKVLWRIVKARFKKIVPVNYMDTFLHLNLKTMFEHHVEDIQTIPYYLVVEKMYPLTKHTLHQMFNNVKLQVDYECKIAFDLLRLVKKQHKEGYVPQ